MNMKTRVFLDTNFLMVPYQEGIDIFQEIRRLVPVFYELVTLSTVKKELEAIKQKGKGKDRIAANVGLELLESKEVRIIESKGEKRVDDELVEIAGINPESMIVCTNDLELKRQLRKLKVGLISMRSKNHLDYA